MMFGTGALADDGAFGLHIGQPLTELDTGEPGPRPALKSVPKPHPAFKKYSAWGSNETGVCILMAFSKTYENDRYGQKIRADFEKFVKAISGKYGSGELIDFRRSGGIWKDADEWVMAIKQNELTYAYSWDSPKNTDEFGYIELRIHAIRSDDSVLKMMYKGKNASKCISEIEAEENDSF